MEQTKTPTRRRRRHRRRNNVPIICLIALLTATLIGLGVFTGVNIANEYHADLTMQGEKAITLEYGATYDEPGANAVGYGTLLKKEPQDIPVEISGKVDTGKVGTYTVSYQATFEDATATSSRTVTVVDTVAPQITLVTDPDHFTFPGQAYEEEGFSATDNYDGDLTGKVTAVEESGKVIYTVADSSGNETQVERAIHYDDPVAPELTLKGDSKITITEGDKWKEPGYTASDNVDGDITDKVTITGAVDHLEPGTYKLTYQVKDQYENTVKAERTVTVKAKPSASGGGQNSESLGKVIYLTFDDGPSKHTDRLLDILAKYNAKATFFVCDTGYYEILPKIAEQGHALALHSQTHKYSQIYSSEDAYYKDLYAIQDIVEKYTGIKSTLLRFPGGSSNGVSKKHNKGIMTRLTQSVQEKGFAYFDWNVDSKDASDAKTADEVARNVINGIKNSSRKNHVVLQHDIKGFSVDAVEQILQWGIANGCTFKALTQEGPICHHGVNN